LESSSRRRESDRGYNVRRFTAVGKKKKDGAGGSYFYVTRTEKGRDLRSAARRGGGGNVFYSYAEEGFGRTRLADLARWKRKGKNRGGASLLSSLSHGWGEKAL